MKFLRIGKVGQEIPVALDKNKKQYLEDALMTSIAGISAAMKNTG